jgi:hypothetical protein
LFLLLRISNSSWNSWLCSDSFIETARKKLQCYFICELQEMNNTHKLFRARLDRSVAIW